MRTTVELRPLLYKMVCRHARLENLSIARVLVRLVERGLQVSTQASSPSMRRGRWHSIAPATPDARVSSEMVYKMIDNEGIL